MHRKKERNKRKIKKMKYIVSSSSSSLSEIVSINHTATIVRTISSSSSFFSEKNLMPKSHSSFVYI